MARTLIVDIETVGEDYESLDQTTQDVLTRWIRKESKDDAEYQVALAELKDGLGFSPLTGFIVAIGMLDCEIEKATVYYHAGEASGDLAEGETVFKAFDEKTMLEKFWQGIRTYQNIVTFNGRTFDVPFLMVRSAVHGVKPSVDLMSNRYLESQRGACKHIDLLDQLTFYGAVRRKGNLHLWSRAFGIHSPKADGVSGEDVARLFRERKFLDIARYNVGDLRATWQLYRAWADYLA
jgi:hypothetical protein